MGNTHFRSNIIGQDGTQNISAFANATVGNLSATNVNVNGSITTPNVTASAVKISGTSSSYIKLGDHQYIIFGSASNQDEVEAAATAIDASCKGSLYIDNAGMLWSMTSDSEAASYNQVS